MAIGAGWQSFVGYVNIVCYYVFGIPLGLILGYKLKLGVQVSSYHALVLSFSRTSSHDTMIPGHMVRNGGWNKHANAYSLFARLQN